MQGRKSEVDIFIQGSLFSGGRAFMWLSICACLYQRSTIPYGDVFSHSTCIGTNARSATRIGESHTGTPEITVSFLSAFTFSAGIS